MWADCCGCSACLPRTGSPVAGFWAWCAAICAALASYLHMVGNERIAARRLRELDGLARSQIALAGRGNALQRRLLEVCPGWEPSPTLLLQLLEAAIAQGVAIPRALECIGACCGGACAQVLGHVSAALLRGVCWDDWHAAHCVPPGRMASRRCRRFMRPLSRWTAANARGSSNGRRDCRCGCCCLWDCACCRRSCSSRWCRRSCRSCVCEAGARRLSTLPATRNVDNGGVIHMRPSGFTPNIGGRIVESSGRPDGKHNIQANETGKERYGTQ